MSDFDRFKQAVWEAYQTKRHRKELPPELEDPRPASLRDYCLRKCQSQLLPKDREALILFFSPDAPDHAIERNIRQFDTDKLKPIIQYLRGDTQNTREKNIKLLAWLIDFEPRPYDAWRRAGKTDIASTDYGSQPAIPTQNERRPVSPPDEEIQKSRMVSKALGWMLGAVSLATAIFFFAWKPGAKQCMYWQEHRYVAIRCSANEPPGALLIALDQERLQGFKKIMRPDTLSLAHVNKVWYSKINNTVEFFTAPGFHPVHLDRALKVASKHIIEQYGGKQAQN